VCGILGDGDGWALQVGAVDVLRFRGGKACKPACSSLKRGTVQSTAGYVNSVAGF